MNHSYHTTTVTQLIVIDLALTMRVVGKGMQKVHATTQNVTTVVT
jgi:hypothetical protein